MQNWDRILSDRFRIRAVLKKLSEKAVDSPSLLKSSAIDDRLTLEWILRHQRDVVKAIRTTVKSGIEFSPQKQTQMVQKGKTRLIYVASWPERILLMVIAQALARELEPKLSNSVYSFRKGRGQRDVTRAFGAFVRKHKGPLYVMKRDISKYGDSIPQDKLFAAVSKRFGVRESKKFLDCFRQAIQIEYQVLGRPDVTACLCKGIPSGSPLVPPLENFYLMPLDEKLDQQKNSFYARYGDDFIFATPDRSVAEVISRMIDLQVEELGLTIKPEKKGDYVLCTNPQKNMGPYIPVQSFDWLGVRINHQGTIGCKREHYLRIRTELEKMARTMIERFAKLPLDFEKRKGLLRHALATLLDINRPTFWSSYVRGQDNDLLLADIDRNLTHVILRALRRHWSMKKQVAWRFYRQLKVPSIRYQRRKNADYRQAA